MKRILALSIAALLPLTSIAAPKAAGGKEVFKANPSESKVSWEGKKVGGAHQGDLALKSGQFEVANNAIVGGKFEIDMTKMTNADISDEGMRTKLLNHLKSDDFFSVDKHPTSTFTITKASPVKDGKQEITGDLVIKGKKDRVSFPAEVSVTDGKLAAKADIKVDRTRYDIKYRSLKFFSAIGDKAIHDDFFVKVDVKAAK